MAAKLTNRSFIATFVSYLMVIAVSLLGISEYPEKRRQTIPILAIFPFDDCTTTAPAKPESITWGNRWWKVGTRVHYTLVTLAVFVGIWWAQYWNLLGFRIHLHIVPRFSGDKIVLDWDNTPAPTEKLSQIAGKIRVRLQDLTSN